MLKKIVHINDNNIFLLNIKMPLNVGGYVLGSDERQFQALVPAVSSLLPTRTTTVVKKEQFDTREASPIPTPAAARSPHLLDHRRQQQQLLLLQQSSDDASSSTSNALRKDGDMQKYCHTWDWTKVRRVTNMHEHVERRKRRTTTKAPPGACSPDALSLCSSDSQDSTSLPADAATSKAAPAAVMEI